MKAAKVRRRAARGTQEPTHLQAGQSYESRCTNPELEVSVGAMVSVEPAALEQTSTGNPCDAPVDIAEVREEIKRAVGEHAVKMVESTISQVEKGNYLAMKYLFEMVGIHPASAGMEPNQDDSMTAILLRSLRIYDDPSPATGNSETKVTNNLNFPAQKDNEGAVE